jgi:DNA-directed RNA polymerase specialized sigma24 family protein
MSNSLISVLLANLSGVQSGKAWQQFLDGWASQLMKIARYNAHVEDQAQDCFLHICEKLSEHGFRRLLQFEESRGVPFESWLSAVANNLCHDWRRQQFGRFKVPTAIREMDDLDQHVYHLKFEKRLEIQACLELAKARYPALTREALSASLARIHQALSARQRWRLSFLNRPVGRRTVSLDTGSGTAQLTGRNVPNPEATTNVALQHQALTTALGLLSTEQRLILHLA